MSRGDVQNGCRRRCYLRHSFSPLFALFLLLLLLLPGGTELATAFPFVPLEPKDSPTDLCTAARAHAGELEPRMLRAYEMLANAYFKEFGQYRISDLARFLKAKHGYDVAKVRLSLGNIGGTRVVKMRLGPKLRGRILREIQWTSKLEGKVKEFLISIGEGDLAKYNPFSLQFNNAILFTPSGFRFYRQNLNIVRELVPDVGGIALNAFAVPANQPAYGAHNARSWAVGLSGLVCEMRPENGSRCMFPHEQRSLHTALEPVTYEHQPLIVYDDAEAEVPTQLYIDTRLDAVFSKEKGGNTYKAVRASHHILSTPGLTDQSVYLTAAQYSFAKYMEVKYCALPWPVKGKYWELRAGQALFFSNYVPHGDSTLPLSSRPRYTIDLRIFSKDIYPKEPEEERPELYKIRLRNELKAKECIAIILGYKDQRELTETITGQPQTQNYTLAHLLTNTALGLHGSYGGERKDILTYEEGLRCSLLSRISQVLRQLISTCRRHFKRTSKILKNEPVLTLAAKTCIREFTQESSCNEEEGVCSTPIP